MPVINEPIDFDFGGAYPTGFCSNRGDYAELSLEFSGEYDGKFSLEDFFDECQTTVGKTFQGWKGGDFRMNKNTRVWVCCEGRTSRTTIKNVEKAKHYGFVINTIDEEY